MSKQTNVNQGCGVGGALGALIFTCLYLVIISPEFHREAGIGHGVFVFFFLLPINTMIGAYYGTISSLAGLALEEGHSKRAGHILIIGGTIVMAGYAALFYPTGFLGFSHHISVLTDEWTSRERDLRDSLAVCGPLVWAMLLLLRGMILITRRQTRLATDKHR